MEQAPRLSPRVRRSLWIGGVVAVALSVLRGGILDFVLVLPLFWLLGFAGAYLVSALASARFLAMIDELAAEPPASTIRETIAFLLAGSAVLWAGPVIAAGSYAAWLLAFLLVPALALLVAVLARRWTLPAAVVAATCVCLSGVLRAERELDGEGWLALAVLWGIFVFLALLVATPLWWQRFRRQHRDA